MARRRREERSQRRQQGGELAGELGEAERLAQEVQRACVEQGLGLAVERVAAEDERGRRDSEGWLASAALAGRARKFFAFCAVGTGLSFDAKHKRFWLASV